MNNQEKKPKIILSELEDNGLKETKILHNTPKVLQPHEIRLHDQYRIVQLSDFGKQQNNLSTFKSYFHLQVFIPELGGWQNVVEPTGHNDPDGNPITYAKIFDNEKECAEYARHVHEIQKKNLHKSKIKHFTKFKK